MSRRKVKRLVRFERNTSGRDFVVGDVHGYFDVLTSLLGYVNFDETVDRLFSVGDLIDRGPQSHEVTHWLDQPWFHACRGNHEQLAIDAEAIVPGMAECHVGNGGIWFFRETKEERKRIAKRLDKLPIAIEIDTPEGLVGLIHADVPHPSWQDFTAHLTDGAELNPVMMQAMWGNRRFRAQDHTPVEGIHRVYTGHIPVRMPRLIGNVAYIDTGVCFPKMGNLTVVNMMDGVVTTTKA